MDILFATIRAHTYLVCERCNLNRHQCHFCGEDLDHFDNDRNGPHPCYSHNSLSSGLAGERGVSSS